MKGQPNHQNFTLLGAIGFLFSLTTETVNEVHLPPFIALLLQEFKDVLCEPRRLPPPRSQDHQTPLLPKPVNLRGYGYRHIKKNAIESIVSEMMNKGITKTSESPFTSHVILVKKKIALENVCRLLQLIN